MPADNAKLLPGEAEPAPTAIPNQLEMHLLSHVFLWASITLFAGFALLHYPAFPHADGTPSGVSVDYWNVAFHWSCLLWLLGFVMLTHWILTLPGPLDKAGLAGCLLKVVAAIFFNVNPLSALLGYAGNYGVNWSNLTGIIFFHVGNCVSVYSMRGQLEWNRVFAPSTLHVVGMWIYLLATTFLVPADALAYQSLVLQKTVNQDFVKFGQLFGSAMLILGSLVYTHWSAYRGSYCACFTSAARCTFRETVGVPGRLVVVSEA